MVISNFGRAAVAYAERLHWPVFPLKPRSKDPRIPKDHGGNGHLDATIDLDQITARWERWPNSNIGIACDDRSGLLAVDVDPRAGGDRGLADPEARHGELLHTIEALSGGDGRHLFYKRPAGVGCRGKLCEGVDIKANGYIVVAPSIHESGRAYC